MHASKPRYAINVVGWIGEGSREGREGGREGGRGGGGEGGGGGER